MFISLCVVSLCVGRAFGVPSPGLWFLGLVVAPILLTAYELVGIARWGQTLGKRFAGLRVVRVDTFEVPGWKRSAIRTLGLAPWSWVSFRYQPLILRRAQGLHDRLAGTVVVDDRAWRSSR